MTKKDFLSLPFVLGISAMVLVVVIAAAVAVPCDGTVPLAKNVETVACVMDANWFCTGQKSSDCPEGTIAASFDPEEMPSPTTERYWSMGTTAQSSELWTTRADWGGSILCLVALHCEWGSTAGMWYCKLTDFVLDDKGKRYESYKDYYIAIDCNPVI